jgi:hypothetical protein
MATRDSFLGANTRPTIKLDIPELEGGVHLRQLSGAEMVEVYGAEGKERRAEDILPAVAALSLCDEHGARLFKADEWPLLYEAHPTHVLSPIVDKALEINRMTKGAAEAAKKA